MNCISIKINNRPNKYFYQLIVRSGGLLRDITRIKLNFNFNKQLKIMENRIDRLDRSNNNYGGQDDLVDAGNGESMFSRRKTAYNMPG